MTACVAVRSLSVLLISHGSKSFRDAIEFGADAWLNLFRPFDLACGTGHTTGLRGVLRTPSTYSAA